MRTTKRLALGALLVAQLLLMRHSCALHLSNEQEQQEHSSDNQESQQHQQPPSNIQANLPAPQQQQQQQQQHSHQQEHDEHHRQHQSQHDHEAATQHQSNQHQHPTQNQQQLTTIAQHYDASTHEPSVTLEMLNRARLVHDAHQNALPQQQQQQQQQDQHLNFQHEPAQASTPVTINGEPAPLQQSQFQRHQQQNQGQTSNGLQQQSTSSQNDQRPSQSTTIAAPKSPQLEQLTNQQQHRVTQSQQQPQQNARDQPDQRSQSNVMLLLQPQPQSQPNMPQQSGQEQQKQLTLQNQLQSQSQLQQSSQGFPQEQQTPPPNYQRQTPPTLRPKLPSVDTFPPQFAPNKNDYLPKTFKYQPPQTAPRQTSSGNIAQQQQQQQQQAMPMQETQQQRQQSQQPQQSQSQSQMQPVQQLVVQQQGQQQQQQQIPQPPPTVPPPPPPPMLAPAQQVVGQSPTGPTGSYKYQPSILSPLYLGHNPFIEILRPLSYADDNIVTLNLSHSHIYEIDSDAFVGQRFEHIDLSNNKLGLIHSRSFRIGPNHSRHTPYDPRANSTGSKQPNAHQQHYATRRPPPAHPKSVTIDFSHNPAIVALSGAFDHIDVPNCLLNFTNSTVELKFGAFKKYFKEHPGHLIDIDTVDCCDQEWLLGYKHNFVARTHCAHDPNLYLLKVSQQTIIDSCIAYVTSARHSMTMPGSGIIHSAAANGPRHNSGGHGDNQQYLTYLILGGTAMVLTSLSIYIIFYMFSLKAAFVYQMQTQKN